MFEADPEDKKTCILRIVTILPIDKDELYKLGWRGDGEGLLNIYMLVVILS